MFFFDTETVGYHGPIVLFQWAIDDGPVYLHEMWRESIDSTLALCEMAAHHLEGVIGFNLGFDWFHVQQCYTTLLLLKEKVGGDALPIDHIDLYATLEPEARFGPCIKPQTALDLMLHARKGPYQSTMQRGDIRIRRVPTTIAQKLADYLGWAIPISDIHFAKFKDRKRRWIVYDIKNDIGEVIPGLQDVVLKFNPSSALKALAVEAGLANSEDEVILFDEVNISKKYPVVELGWAPFAMAHGKPGDFGSWNGAWPQVIRMHIDHWAFDPKAREYAEKDVIYTRGLYYHFDCPPCGDDDSILACMVGSVRWAGFSLDLPKLRALYEDVQSWLDECPYNFNSVPVCKTYLEQVLSDTEKVAIQGSTKKVILEEMLKWTLGSVCDVCGGLGVILDLNLQDGEKPCTDTRCKEGEIPNPDKPHPVAKRARFVLDFRRKQNEKTLYAKLIKAGRFHVDVNVIGTLSSRVSGGGGLNATGINKQFAVRDCFPLADGWFILCGGDFAGFEVTLMDAAYGDENLRRELTTRRKCIKCYHEEESHWPSPEKVARVTKELKGKREVVVDKTRGAECECKSCDENCTQETKIHALFGINFFEGMSYADILATKGLPEEQDRYSRSKNGLFALAYGGEAFTLMNRVGVSEECAQKGYEKFMTDFPTFAKERAKVKDAFEPVEQPNGLGSKPFWKRDPADFVESMFGFKRFFTLENLVLKALWQVCQKPPKEWYEIAEKVIRREERGAQSAVNAMRSALLGAIFGLQGANTRAAGNHKIQSAGAHLCKKLQCRMWNLQPAGIHAFLIKTMNIHDEIMAPVVEKLIVVLEKLVQEFVEEFRKEVPLLDIDWGSRLKSWAAK